MIFFLKHRSILQIRFPLTRFQWPNRTWDWLPKRVRSETVCWIQNIFMNTNNFLEYRNRKWIFDHNHIISFHREKLFYPNRNVRFEEFFCWPRNSFPTLTVFLCRFIGKMLKIAPAEIITFLKVDNELVGTVDIQNIVKFPIIFKVTTQKQNDKIRKAFMAPLTKKANKWCQPYTLSRR